VTEPAPAASAPAAASSAAAAHAAESSSEGSIDSGDATRPSGSGVKKSGGGGKRKRRSVASEYKKRSFKKRRIAEADESAPAPAAASSMDTREDADTDAGSSGAPALAFGDADGDAVMVQTSDTAGAAGGEDEHSPADSDADAEPHYEVEKILKRRHKKGASCSLKFDSSTGAIVIACVARVAAGRPRAYSSTKFVGKGTGPSRTRGSPRSISSAWKCSRNSRPRSHRYFRLTCLCPVLL
jgi:hypothetical protein